MRFGRVGRVSPPRLEHYFWTSNLLKSTEFSPDITEARIGGIRRQSNAR